MEINLCIVLGCGNLVAEETEDEKMLEMPMVNSSQVSLSPDIESNQTLSTISTIL